MAFLINRNPPARLQCLHSLCKFIDTKIGVGVQFRMNDIKFNPDELNIHSFCDLLIENKELDIKYCRYKDNPFSASGCSLTNGIFDDTTKSKEVSNTINSLHALGFVDRIGNKLVLTPSGSEFSKTKFESQEMLILIQNSVLKYGLLIGVLFQIYKLDKEVFDTAEINVGYPKANERLEYNGSLVTISSGSEDDSNTRTKSCLLAWATTAGFICPLPILDSLDIKQPHVSSSDYILQNNRNYRKFKVIKIPKRLFEGSFVTERPLDYNNLTKNIGALRENNQKEIRELTLTVKPKIQNRRLAILYLLNRAFKEYKHLSIKSLIDFMLMHENVFVIEKSVIHDTIWEELNIAFISGIPFTLEKNEVLKPHTGINLQELTINAPDELISILDKFQFK
jgi:hypothetical protein